MALNPSADAAYTQLLTGDPEKDIHILANEILHLRKEVINNEQHIEDLQKVIEETEKKLSWGRGVMWAVGGIGAIALTLFEIFRRGP